jgi:hypothetical protein
MGAPTVTAIGLMFFVSKRILFVDTGLVLWRRFTRSNLSLSARAHLTREPLKLRAIGTSTVTALNPGTVELKLPFRVSLRGNRGVTGS